MKQDDNAATFSQDSSGYQTSRPQYPRELYSYLANLCSQTERVWDCATGTGQAALALADYFDQVLATDISQEQLNAAPEHPKVQFSAQDSKKTNFPDQYFDLVTVAQALHWFAGDEFFSEVQRVLRPGGVFACWGYGFHKISPQIDPVMEKTIFSPLKDYWSPGNKLLWDGYRDLQIPFVELDSPQFPMVMHWTSLEFSSYIQTWSGFKRHKEATDGNLIPAFLEGVGEHWSGEQKVPVKMDFFLRVFRPS